MKNINHYPIKKIFYLILTIIFIFLLIIGYRHILSKVDTSSTMATAHTNSFTSKKTNAIERCEIIVNEPTTEYLQNLQVNYPDCKIIQKQNIYQFDLINYLLNLFQ